MPFLHFPAHLSQPGLVLLKQCIFLDATEDGLHKMSCGGYISNKILMFHPIEEMGQERMRDLMEQYRDTPMDLADASLVTTAEALNQRRVFTLDSDFHIYRFSGTQTFEIVP